MSHPPSAPGPQGPDYGQQPGPYQGPPGQYPPGYGQPPQKKSKKKWAIGCLGLIVLAILLFGGCAALLGGGAEDTAPTPDGTVSAPNAERTEDAPASEEPQATPKAEQNAEQPSMTVAQQNAVRSAESYIDMSGFSRSGLIEQLEFEDYSTEDATAAVDSLNIDFNEQAARSAKSYLEMSGFSRQGLIDQLVFEGYTAEQAAYGADQAGL